MRIKSVNNSMILFDNGTAITYEHDKDCCEYNYADFEQLEEASHDFNFSEDLIFESVENYGFRFGSIGTPMFFVPCYSEQNGYYSTDIDILFDGKQVLNLCCQFRDDDY